MAEMNIKSINLEPIIYAFVELIEENNSEFDPPAWSNLDMLIAKLKEIPNNQDTILIETIQDWCDEYSDKINSALTQKIQALMRGNLHELKPNWQEKKLQNQSNKITNKDYVLETIRAAIDPEQAQEKKSTK